MDCITTRQHYCYGKNGLLYEELQSRQVVFTCNLVIFFFNAVIVALANCEVRVYKEKYLVNSFKMDVSRNNVGCNVGYNVVGCNVGCNVGYNIGCRVDVRLF